MTPAVGKGDRKRPFRIMHWGTWTREGLRERKKTNNSLFTQFPSVILFSLRVLWQNVVYCIYRNKWPQACWAVSGVCLGQLKHVPVWACWPATCTSVCKLMNVCFRRELLCLCVCLSIYWCWWTFTPVYFWDGSSFKSQSSGSREIAVENIEHYLSHYNPQLSKPLQHSHLLLATLTSNIFNPENSFDPQ